MFSQGVHDISDTWENMQFVVLRHMKGTEDRGFILGAMEDILQCLEDNAMSLQIMAASRFVGPFLSEVHLWEQSLSLIAEVIEVNFNQFVFHCLNDQN